MAGAAKEKRAEPSGPAQGFAWRTTLGTLFLAISLAASVLLSVDSLGLARLPGCGIGSPCARASAGPLGRVPGLDWPTAFFGLAYFGAALTGWMVSGGNLNRAARWAVRVSAVVSALLILAAFSYGTPCSYCLAANAANLAFALLVEWPRLDRYAPAPPGWRRQLATPVALSVFISLCAGLILANDAARAADRLRIRAQAADFADRAREASQGGAAAAADAGSDVPKGLTGRWRRGPERSPIRIVVFTDYQCPDCKVIEGELEAAMQRHPGASLSVRYFPLSSDCNPHMGGRNLHPNACWAARAAEAAGTLGGADAFWKMHRWLFEKGGVFESEAALAEGAARAGIEPRALAASIQAASHNDAIAEDIALGVDLGLTNTPMVFVNGAEVRSWQTAGAVGAAIDAVAASSPPAAGPENDRPPRSVDKAVADWRAQSEADLPRDPLRPALGSIGGEARRVVVIGDLLHEGTAQADALVRARIASGAPIRYEFRHFPLNKSCNPASPADLHEHSCLAARAAEGAGLAGGAQSQRLMHEWLWNNRDRISEQALRDGAPAMATGDGELFSAMSNPVIAERIAADVALAQKLGIREVPAVYVDGRLVPRLKVPDGKGGWVDVLGRVLGAER